MCEIDHFALSPHEGMDGFIIRGSGGASDVSGVINRTSEAETTSERSQVQEFCAIPEKGVNRRISVQCRTARYLTAVIYRALPFISPVHSTSGYSLRSAPPSEIHH